MNTEVSNLKLLKKLHILIIEDDEELLENLSSTLSLFCENIEQASNGKEALTVIEHKPIDLIITDYVMPEISGYEFIKLIRQDNPLIPISVMSNYSDQEKLISLIPLELTSFIIKPLKYDDILNMLSKMVDKLLKHNLLFEQLSTTLAYDHIVKVLRDGETTVALTKNETVLIELFLKNKNKLVTKNMIEYNLNDRALSDQAVKNMIHRLRQKVGKALIVTIKELGYMMRLEETVL
jgi:DNA-binding response OmpR family regulator